MLSDPSTLLFQAVCALGLYLLLTLLQFAGRRILVLREMRRPLNVLFALGAVHTFLGDRLAAVHPSLRMAVLVAFLTLLAFAGIRLVDRLLFDMLPARRQRQPVPVVVRDILKWILWGTAVFFILRSTVLPNLKLSVLAVSSIVVGYILGNASQDTLGNLIAGLALNTERPFSIGDWVQVGEFAGRVSDMTWRATRLQTKARDHIIIPNSTIAREFIVNYSRPTTAHGFTQQIGVNYDVPPNVVRETLIRVCDEIPEILPHPRPVVWLQKYNDFSMDYVLKFYINDFARLEEIQSLMMDRVWYHFKRRGIVIPFPIRDVRHFDTMQRLQEEQLAQDRLDYRAIVDATPLLQPLSDEERRIVTEALREEIYGAGEVLVRESEAGHTFYLIRSGRVAVQSRQGSATVRLAELGRGDCFGEMSLLTGEPRSATVVAETDTVVLVLDHTVLGDMLKRNQQLADELAAMLERRAGEQRERRAAAPAPTPATPVAEPSHAIVSRIRRFFGLGQGAA